MRQWHGDRVAILGDASVSPSNFGYHWNHNGESQYLNGKTMGKQMVEMLAP
jgi:hypothetical protein